MIKKRRRFSEN